MGIIVNDIESPKAQPTNQEIADKLDKIILLLDNKSQYPIPNFKKEIKKEICNKCGEITTNYTEYGKGCEYRHCICKECDNK